MNVSSDVYSMRIYCCQHKKQMGETTAEPRAKTVKCSHCIRVCGSRIECTVRAGTAATRLTHCGRITHCLSRQKEANNNNNIHNKHQLFNQLPVVFLADWLTQYCGGFSYCNGRPPTNSILKFSVYNLLDATSM